MPAPIDDITKRRVVQQWLSGDSRPKIAIDNNLGEGTVSGIVRDFKIGLDNSEFDSARDLALAAKKQGLNLSDLASNFRLRNFIKESGAAEDRIEPFITKVSTTDVSPEQTIELVYQLYEISRGETIPLHQVPGYIGEKLQEKQKIDEEVQQADTLLQTKNVKAKTINEYMKLNEKLNKNGLSIQDINKLVKLLVNAKRYGFDAKKIVGKLSNIKQLEKKEKGLENNCKILSKQAAKYKDILPMTEEIAALGIDIDELIALKVGINEAVKHYNLPPLTATLRLINDIKKI
jgi:hypothetical protein